MEVRMTIHLTDVSMASKDYVTENVDCQIKYKMDEAPRSIPKGESFEFELSVTNTGSLPLTNVRYELASSDGEVFRFVAPKRRVGSLLTRNTSPAHLGTEIAKAEQIDPGEEVETMAVWPAGFEWEREKAQLEPGETDTWRIEAKSIGSGKGKIKARILGDIDLPALARSKPSDWVSHEIESD